jgi:hypothetical protein
VSATQAPEGITITTIDPDGFLFDELREGQGLGMGAAGFLEYTRFDGLTDEDANTACRRAWEEDVIDPAIEEVLPKIRDLIAGAVERRLPWEWPE